MTGEFVISESIAITSKAPAFLIVCLRYIGDVLVTTPLAFSIKQAIPNAIVDYLVFEGTEMVLAKNQYVDHVMTIPPGSKDTNFATSLWNRYDIAIATGTSDRMVIFSAIAGRKRVGLLYRLPKEWWKRLLLNTHVQYDDTRHVVWNILATLAPLGIPAFPRVVMGYDDADVDFAKQRLPAGKFIVMHPYSRGSYKQWPAEHWARLASLIEEQLGVAAIFSITPSEDDQKVLQQIKSYATNSLKTFPEPFTLNQVAAALALSCAYIGIDTVVTHIAAAVGAPTIAVYGPTLTRYWAPWPAANCNEASPFAANSGIQRAGNVTVAQRDWSCVPCNGEWCAISNRGVMECLDTLSVETVFWEVRRHVYAH